MLNFARPFATCLLATLCVGRVGGNEPVPPSPEADVAAEATVQAESEPVDFPRAEAIFPQLEPILVHALAQSPRMIQENLALVAAAYDRYVEKTVLYPRIAGYGQFNVQREDRVTDTGDGDSSAEPETVAKTYYDVTLTQPLFHWGALKAQADIGRLRYQLAERNYREVYQGLANEIRDAYLRLVVARIAQRNQRIELDRARQQLERVRQQVEEGREVAGSITTLVYTIDAMVLAADRADVALDRALELFRQLIGQPDLGLDAIPEMIPAPTPVDRTKSLPLRQDYVNQREFEDHQRYFNSQRSLDMQKLSLKATRANLRPRFDLAAGINQDEVDRTGDVTNKYQLATTYVGLRVNWAIFDSFRTRALVRAARSRISSTELSLKQIERDLIAAIELSETELSFQTRSLAVAERNFAGAESTYTSAIEFQKDGRYSQDDVEAARAALRSAEYTICETRRVYLRTVAEFLATVGADPLVERLSAEGAFPR